jgi:flagellar biosynthesis/type III secretory pathway M-ring protein FliF/YscJ
MDEFFDNLQDNWLWIALAILLALIVLGVLAALAKRKKRERNREHATELRREAAHRSTKVEVEDAEARRIEAESLKAQAEADRLQAIAEHKRTGVEEERGENVQRIEEADKLDPGRRHRDDGDPTT